jgi:uncharacterized membrane protein
MIRNDKGDIVEFGPFQIFWLACGAATMIGAVMAHRGRRWRYVGRAGVGALFLFGGALYNFLLLVSGGDFTDFADTAHFAWVTDAWRAVVAPNQILFIGLLVAFEATVGVLILSGGRRTQLGYTGVIGFYLALWLFGGFQLIWSVLMLPFMILLLVAERRAATTPIGATQVEDRPLADITS